MSDTAWPSHSRCQLRLARRAGMVPGAVIGKGSPRPAGPVSLLAGRRTLLAGRRTLLAGRPTRRGHRRGDEQPDLADAGGQPASARLALGQALDDLHELLADTLHLLGGQPAGGTGQPPRLLPLLRLLIPAP